MFKKFASLAGAGALLLGMAVPVLASVYVYNEGLAFQGTEAIAIATTGGNSYTAGENGGSISQSGSISTGNTLAVAVAQSTANQFDTTVWSDCDCGVEVYNLGGAEQGTGAMALADTGLNSYLAGENDGDISQSGDTTTGSAGAGATAQSWANIYTTFVGAWSIGPLD